MPTLNAEAAKCHCELASPEPPTGSVWCQEPGSSAIGCVTWSAWPGPCSCSGAVGGWLARVGRGSGCPASCSADWLPSAGRWGSPAHSPALGSAFNLGLQASHQCTQHVPASWGLRRGGMRAARSVGSAGGFSLKGGPATPRKGLLIWGLPLLASFCHVWRVCVFQFRKEDSALSPSLDPWALTHSP